MYELVRPSASEYISRFKIAGSSILFSVSGGTDGLGHSAPGTQSRYGPRVDLFRLRESVCRVHLIRYLVEPIAVQMAVPIERHRGRRMPEHLLHDLHVRAGRDRQGRRGVPQRVRRDSVEASRPYGPVEDDVAEVLQSEQAALGRGEYEVVWCLARGQLGDVLDDEAWDRHGADLMGLRCAEDCSSLHLGDG